MRIGAHGIELELPRGWDGRLYRVAGSAPILHAASFPLPLAAGHFNPHALQVGRRGQAGMQHFFTASGRPFCLYAVIATRPAASASTAGAHDRVGQLSAILATLQVRETQ